MNKTAAIGAGVAALAIAGATTGGIALSREGSTTTTVVLQTPQNPTVGEDFAPAPTTGFDLRVGLISCGVQKSYSVNVNDTILLVNDGTVERYLDPAPSGPPLPTYLIVPKDWFTFSISQPGTYRVTVQHAQCSKAYAQRLTFTVT